MVPVGKRYVTYLRVSTARQGDSGLGLEAQQKAVADYLRTQNGGTVIAEYREVESGKVNERPQLQAALKRCRQSRATLLIAKLDRLGRNTSFLLGLRDAGVKFVCADNPTADDTTIGILAVFAQHEAKAISVRTIAALAAYKANPKNKDKPLGNPRLQAGNAATAAVARQGLTAKADAFARDLRETIEDARANGHTTLQQIAAYLTSLSVATPRGSEWTPTAAARVLARLGMR